MKCSLQVRLPFFSNGFINSPTWLSIQAVPVMDEMLNALDPGEQAAMTLAQTLPADLLIIDERLGRRIANERGIPISKTS